MFLSVIRPATRVSVSRAATMAPRIAGNHLGSSVNAVRFFSLGDELKKKESVEEARYMREQEAKFIEKKKAEKAAAAAAEEMVVFQEVLAPAMVECQEILKKTGDSVSAEGLELLAKWKLGISK